MKTNLANDKNKLKNDTNILKASQLSINEQMKQLKVNQELFLKEMELKNKSLIVKEMELHNKELELKDKLEKYDLSVTENFNQISKDALKTIEMQKKEIIEREIQLKNDRNKFEIEKEMFRRSQMVDTMVQETLSIAPSKNDNGEEEENDRRSSFAPLSKSPRRQPRKVSTSLADEDKVLAKIEVSKTKPKKQNKFQKKMSDMMAQAEQQKQAQQKGKK